MTTLAPPTVSPSVDLDALFKLVEQKYITCRTHGRLPYLIWNYGPKTQFDRFWTPETRMCRGLITDLEGKVLYRPFPKFFSLGDPVADEPPDEPFVVYEKLDGSLGIQYRDGDTWAIATRGSFGSGQAGVATHIFREKYGHLDFREDRTYLWEIIFPENRIVVDYGERRDLILLAVIDTATGRDDDAEVMRLEDAGVPVAETYETPEDIEDLVFTDDGDDENREGYVCRFDSGLRLKIKFTRYAFVHRLLTGISPKFIWEQLRDGKDLAPLLERAPDGFARWIEMHATTLRKTYSFVERRAQSAFEKRPATEDRKALAAYFQTCHDPAVLFKMLDGHKYEEVLWKMCRPEGGRPYKVIDE